MLFSAKKQTFETARDLALEIAANSQRLLILTEGTLDLILRAVSDLYQWERRDSDRCRVLLLSSSTSSDSLGRIAESLRGQKVSLLVAFDGEPSSRLLWILQILYGELSKGRSSEEVARRVIFCMNSREIAWERWIRSRNHRLLELSPKCQSRYLFFSEPVALLLELLGEPAWQFVEGARSFFRGSEKIGELEDPVFALAALREVQLAEHFRETLVVPDETFLGFGRWWKDLTEDTRRAFSEEGGDGLVRIGRAWVEPVSCPRPSWNFELAIDGASDYLVEALPGGGPHPTSAEMFPASWSRLEALSLEAGQARVSGKNGDSPTLAVKLALRRKEPFCIGALFGLMETLVCVSHRLAEVDDAVFYREPVICAEEMLA